MSSEETEGEDTIILHIWPGEWNLPSLDPDFKIQNDDFIEILPQKISQLN